MAGTEFELTYTLDAAGLEMAREAMFENEIGFAFHEAPVQAVEVRTLRLGPSRLCRVISSGHTISLLEPDHVTVLLPRAGRVVVETDGEEIAVGPRQMLVCTPNARVTHVLPDRRGRFESLCALLRLGGPEDAAGKTPPLRPVTRAYADLSGAPGTRNLHRCIDYVATAAQGPAGALAAPRARIAAGVLLAEAARTLIADAAGAAAPRRLPGPNDRRLVRRAEDIMRARHADPLTTGEIAALLGVGARRLQCAFESVRDAPPLGVLKSIRLAEARERLQDPNGTGTVTSIALDCGFCHLGRFAGAYAQTYGESPSETLRRCRR